MTLPIPPTPSRFRVEKQRYSAGAWRVLWADTGRQVTEWMDYPHLVGGVQLPRFLHPVCFDRKRDAVAWIAAHEPEASCA